MRIRGDQKATSSINSDDLTNHGANYGERIVAEGDANEMLIPGQDKFSVTCEKVEGCKLSDGKDVGTVFWSHELGFHTETHAFHWASNPRHEIHHGNDRVAQLRETNKASRVEHADGSPVTTGVDLVLTAIPLTRIERERYLQEQARLQYDTDETSSDAATRLATGRDVDHMTPDQKREYFEQVREQNTRELRDSPTHGRRLEEVQNTYGAVKVKMDEILARRNGKVGHTDQLRAEAEAEFHYAMERARNPENRASRSLWSFKADFAPSAREVLRQRAAGLRPEGRSSTRT